MADKIRIKKYQKLKVQQWCEALLVSESRFVEDAIGFYLRYLEGKHPVTPTLPVATTESLNGHGVLHEKNGEGLYDNSSSPHDKSWSLEPSPFFRGQMRHKELPSVKSVAIETDDPEEFDGGIEL